MQPSAAKVAVIMPAYNASEFIESSVRSILAQSYKELELIVIDDGSKDDTAAILSRIAAEDPRLRPLSIPNGGPANARNRGLELVSPGTEYIMFADSDDELRQDAFGLKEPEELEEEVHADIEELSRLRQETEQKVRPIWGELARQAPGCLSCSVGEGTKSRHSFLLLAFVEHPRAGTRAARGTLHIDQPGA